MWRALQPAQALHVQHSRKERGRRGAEAATRVSSKGRKIGTSKNSMETVSTEIHVTVTALVTKWVSYLQKSLPALSQVLSRGSAPALSSSCTAAWWLLAAATMSGVRPDTDGRSTNERAEDVLWQRKRSAKQGRCIESHCPVVARLFAGLYRAHEEPLPCGRSAGCVDTAA